MQTFRCFTRDELQDYLLGNVLDDLTEVIAAHLETCARCEETVVALDQIEDTLVGQLKSPALRDQLASPLPQSHAPTLEAAKQKLVKQIAEGLAMSDIGAVLDRVSQQRIGDYELIEPLARGGMGDVYRARHLRLEKTVALKILPQHRMRHGDAISRFAREMKIIGQMNHPAIVAAFDAGEETGIHYLTMEYIDGMDVSKLVRTLGPLEAENACEIVRQAAVGIEYAHQLGVVHRDIKPSNLMLDRQGQIKILDLGLATLNGTDCVTDELTTVGQLLGTLDYMAPEQCDESESIDRRCDVYGLGATLYKLLTGCAPYDREGLVSPLKKLRAIATSEPIPIRDRAPDIDSRLAAIVMKCLSRHPADRFGSAGELAQELSPWAHGQTLSEVLSQAQELRGALAALEPAAVNPPKLQSYPKTRLQPSHVAIGPALQTGKPMGPSHPRRGIRHWMRVACAALGLGLIAWSGIVIILEYSGGRLVIESEVEGIQVAILQDAGPHSELRIEHGTASTRLWAGKYRVQIDGASNQLTITNDTFELRRGQTVIARITRTEPLSDSASRPGPASFSPEPKYGGQTFAELTTQYLSGSSYYMSPGIRVLANALTQEQRQAWIEQIILTFESEKEFNARRKIVTYLASLPVTWPELRLVLDNYYESLLEPEHPDQSERIWKVFDWQMFYPSFRGELIGYLDTQLSVANSPDKHPLRAAAAIVAIQELAELEGETFELDRQLTDNLIAAGNYLLKPQVMARISQSDQTKCEACLVRLLSSQLATDRQVEQLFRAMLRRSSSADVVHKALVSLLALTPQPDDGVDLVLEYFERGAELINTTSLLEQIANHPQFEPRLRDALRDPSWGMQPVKGLGVGQIQLGGGNRMGAIMSGGGAGAAAGVMVDDLLGGGLSVNATGRSNLIATLGNTKHISAPFVGDLREQLEWLTDPAQRTVTYRALAAITGQTAPPLHQGYELQHYMNLLDSPDMETVVAALSGIKSFFESRNRDDGQLTTAVIRIVERATSFDFLDPQWVSSPAGRAFLDVFRSPRPHRVDGAHRARAILEEQLMQVPTESAPFVFGVFYQANLSNSRNLYRFASNFFESESELLRRRAWAIALESGSQLDKTRQDQLLSSPSAPELKMAFLLDPRASGTIAVSDDWTDAELATLLNTFALSQPVSVAINPMLEQLAKRASRVLEQIQPLTLDLWNGPVSSTADPTESKTLLEFYLMFLDWNPPALLRAGNQNGHLDSLIESLTQTRGHLDPQLKQRLDSWLSRFQ